jgi:hypothetical protein
MPTIEEMRAQLKASEGPPSQMPSIEDMRSQLKSGPAPMDTIPVVQEQHPELTMADRLITKNFANNNEAAVNYLQKQHPDLEISIKNDQIVARSRNATTNEPYKVLDPDKGTLGNLNPFSTEFYKDIADAGYDTLAGAASAAAAGAGGVAGAPTVAGALPAAAAAGAGTSAALEGLRQKIGNALGIDQGTDWANIGVSGLAGAATPALFGTGATAKQLGSNALRTAFSSAGEDLAPEALASAQRGILGRAADSAPGQWVQNQVGEKAARLGSMISGAPKDSLETFAKDNANYLAMENTRGGVTKEMLATGSMLNRRASEEKSLAWGKFQDSVKSLGKDAVIDTAPLHTAFQTSLDEAKGYADELGTDASQELYQRLKDAYDGTLLKTVGVDAETGEAVKEPIANLSVSAAAKLEQQLSDLAGYGQLKGKVSGNRFTQAQDAADKELMTLAARLKSSLGDQIDEHLSDTAKQAKERFIEVANAKNSVDKLMQSPQQAFTNLKNAGIDSNVVKRETFEHLDDVLNLNGALTNKAKLFETYETFHPGRKSFFSDLKNRTSVPAGVAGGALGYIAGSGGSRDGEGGGGFGPWIGALAGGSAGALLGGPGAMRRYIQFGLNNASRANAINTTTGLGNAAILNYGTKPAIKSAWELMNEGK